MFVRAARAISARLFLPLQHPCAAVVKNLHGSHSSTVGRRQRRAKVKGSLTKLEKKTTGTLMTRDVSDLVRAEHFVHDSGGTGSCMEAHLPHDLTIAADG